MPLSQQDVVAISKIDELFGQVDCAAGLSLCEGRNVSNHEGVSVSVSVLRSEGTCCDHSRKTIITVGSLLF